jgi:hypothetical protein
MSLSQKDKIPTLGKKKNLQIRSTRKEIGSRVDQGTSQLLQKLPSYMNIP